MPCSPTDPVCLVHIAMAMVQPADMAVKANQILARFRPIAPKPAALPTAPAAQAIDSAAAAAANRVLCHLQSRPCRARKRGRPTVVPVSPSSAKKKRSAFPDVPLRCGAAAATDAVVATATRAHLSVSVPGGACMSLASLSPTSVGAGEEETDVPVERDLLRKLLEPKVISPRAVRPVGSTIHIDSIDIHGTGTDAPSCTASKTAEEVEAELETDALPAVVTDSSNRVRLVNDAYKKMVGAPECPWLGPLARRISGEVALVVVQEQHAAMPPESRGGFSCTAKIEWERRGGERASIHAACDVTRLQCDARDYLFAWRFHTADASSVSGSRTGDA